MARTAGIRWTKSLSSDLAREVKNYNARVKRASIKYPNAQMPSTVSMKDLRVGIKTKGQYNQVMRDLRFATAKSLAPTGKRGKGKSEYLKRMDKRARARKKSVLGDVQEKTKLREEILEKLRVDKKPGRFPTDRDMLIRDIGMQEGAIENYQRLLNWIDAIPNRTMQWRQNYLKAIENVMEGAMSAGNDEAVAALEKLHQTVSSMDIEDYVIGQLVNSAGLEIAYIYPHRGEGENELADRINRIIYDWEHIYG